MKRLHAAGQYGFTLIELLVYMVISSALTAGMYQTFAAQQKSYLHQNTAAELQQNLRTGMYLMTKDIHSAGYNPARKTSPGFVTSFAAPNHQFTINYATQKDIIAFTTDTNGNGVIDPNNSEMIAYRLNAVNHTLERFQATPAGGAWEAVANNVEAVNFISLTRDGTVTTVARDIRAVEIALLVRSGKPDLKFINNEVYRNKQGTVLCGTCAGDHYYRRLLTTTVQARNLF